jgi:PleD family two-component response regulator
VKALIYEYNLDEKRKITDILGQLEISFKFTSLFEDVIYLNEEYAPDIIILNMSEESDEDYFIISEIKKLDFIKYTYVIVLTKNGGIEVGNICLTAGADDYFEAKLIDTELVHRVESGKSVINLFH